MKTRTVISLLSFMIIIAVIVAGAAVYKSSRAKTEFTEVTGTIHEYVKKVKEIKLEDLGTNLALNLEADTNAYTQDKTPDTVTDGDITTYWEGAPNAYPNTLTVDLRESRTVKAVRIRLNPDTIWEKRTQTFSILGSTDNEKFTDIVASADYIFDPEENMNTVTVKFDPVNVQYLRLEYTANTAATAGQAAEFEIY